jgi:acetoin utilization deacetylase AcuC-like enzyme
MLKTGIVYDDLFLRHQTGAGHPERPERLTAIVERLKKDGLLAQLVLLPPRPAELEWITAVHSPEYVARVERVCKDGPTQLDSLDTPVSAESYAVARAAVGGVLAVCDAVMEGKLRNAFCAVRPPGHHALKSRAMGFCLFGNVAIAARYLQKKHRLERILIVDWDVHHGNGTQAAFNEDPSILVFDVHRSPFYPGTGREDETGEGRARGTKINVPLPAGSGDREYLAAFETRLRPAALAFRPQFVLISAGFDAHERDPLGGMKVTADGYAALTRIVKDIADRSCQGRLVSVLEGGYDLDGLASSVAAHLRVLME